MYYFIVNPSSRSGHGLKVWQKVEAELERVSVEYRVFFTSKRLSATELVRDITGQPGQHTIVALGGDGTVNEAVNGIQDFSRVTFAYIPTGSSNDFARSLGLPHDPAAAVQNILYPTYYVKTDLGELQYDGNTRLFVVSCGIGFDAAVCHEALRSRIKDVLNHLGLGKLTYVGIALRQLLLLPAFPISIRLNNGLKLSFPKIFFVSVQNFPYEGGGLKMCPHADDKDGKLDLCVVERLSKLFLAAVLPTAYFGKHTIFRQVHLHKGESIHLKTTVPMPVHVDGESCQCQTDISLRCLPARLKVITGNRNDF